MSRLARAYPDDASRWDTATPSYDGDAADAPTFCAYGRGPDDNCAEEIASDAESAYCAAHRYLDGARCGRCNGTGRVAAIPSEIEPFAADGACPACAGVGYLPDEIVDPCDECGECVGPAHDCEGPRVMLPARGAA